MTILIGNPITHHAISTDMVGGPQIVLASTWVHIAEHDSEATDPDRDFQRERAAFEQQLPILRTRFPGKYVAIHNGRVQETGASEAEAFRRFFDRFGDTHVYIGYVGDGEPGGFQLTPFNL